MSRAGADVVEPAWPHVRRRHPETAGEPDERLSSVALVPRRDARDPKGGAAKLNGEMVYLWRAVDQEGEILESYITKTRDKEAALTFMKNALNRHGSPERITTDGLRSYCAGISEMGNAQVQANEDASEVRFSPRQRPRPLQPRTPPRRSLDLQGPPLGRIGRVAVTHGLRPRDPSYSSANRRQVAIRHSTRITSSQGGLTYGDYRTILASGK